MGWKFLLFDLDNTLLDFPADEQRAFRQMYEVHGLAAQLPFSPELLACYQRHNRAWWQRFERKECTKQELFEGRYAAFLAETGLAGRPEVLNKTYLEVFGQGGVALPGALEMLERLAKKHEIYVVTNGNAASAHSRIANSGVGKYIQGCFVSETIGVGKPDPRYFERVFREIPGFEKEKAVLIGDAPATDIAGANAVGLASIYLPPPWEDPAADVPATFAVRSFQELEELLSAHEIS